MKEDDTPATKADIQQILKEFTKVNGRIDVLDQRMDKFDQRMDKFDQRMDKFDHRMDGLDGRVDGLGQRIEALDQKLDAFRQETVVKLDEIHRECGILVENTHTDVAGASADVDQILKEKNDALERRVARLEEAVGLAA